MIQFAVNNADAKTIDLYLALDAESLHALLELKEGQAFEVDGPTLDDGRQIKILLARKFGGAQQDGALRERRAS